MKTVLKILLAVIIVAGICFGIYCMLPETSKMYVKGNIQYRTDDTAKAQIDKIKGTKIPNSDVTFGTGLEKLCKSTAWYYEETSSENWRVTFYGTKATMDLTTAGMDNVYTDKPMQVSFSVRNNSAVDITITIGGDILSTDEAKAAAYEKIAKAD
jgi:uncharacterized protein YxeA